ncbi:hypothetical protein, partial [Sedimenticola sp.]|uniref:hypothetical protein n=1 Tax=Sedimenticola sp. TaxID=1940285 RepID=UPI003D0A6117
LFRDLQDEKSVNPFPVLYGFPDTRRRHPYPTSGDRLEGCSLMFDQVLKLNDDIFIVAIFHPFISPSIWAAGSLKIAVAELAHEQSIAHSAYRTVRHIEKSVYGRRIDSRPDKPRWILKKP